MSTKDYYAILGVHRTASIEDIKAAYNYRVRIVHPDRFTQGSADWNNANTMLAELNEAYAYLKGQKQRQCTASGQETAENKQEPPKTQPKEESKKEETPPQEETEFVYRGSGMTHSMPNDVQKESSQHNRFGKLIFSVLCTGFFVFVAVIFYHGTREQVIGSATRYLNKTPETSLTESQLADIRKEIKDKESNSAPFKIPQPILAVPLDPIENQTPDSTIDDTSEIINSSSTENKKYSTEGHSKSNGLHVAVAYPSAWETADGERPHIVQKFIGPTSNNITPLALIYIEQMPLNKRSLNKQEMEEFFLETKKAIQDSADSVYIDGRITSIDGEPAFLLSTSNTIERAGVRAYIRELRFAFFYNNTLFMLQCMVVGPEDQEDDIDESFSKYTPTFMKIINSIVIHDKWEKRK